METFCCRNPISLSEIELGPSMIKFEETNSLVEIIFAPKLNFALTQSSQDFLQKHQELVSFSLFLRLQNYQFSWTFSLTFTRLQCCGLMLQRERERSKEECILFVGKLLEYIVIQCTTVQGRSSCDFLGFLESF